MNRGERMKLSKAVSLALLGLSSVAASCPPSGGEPGDPNTPPSGAWVCANENQVQGYVQATQPVTDEQGRIQFIIKTNPQNTQLRSLAAASSVEATLTQQFGLVNVRSHSFSSVGGRVRSLAGTTEPGRIYSGFGSQEQGRLVLGFPGVVRVEENGVKSLPEPKVNPKATEGWPADRVNQRTLPLDGNREMALGDGGRGQHVYVLDTGCEEGDFEGTFGEGFNVFTGGPDASSGHAHGPSVASQIGSKRWGIAPNVTIHCVKVLSDQGSGSDLGVAEGQDWITAHVQANGWSALWNESLGGGVSPTIDESVCRAIEAGIWTVLAAGNSGPITTSCEGSPARVWEAITVGATDQSDNIAQFSQEGGCTNTHGPGVCTDGARYDCADGTSFASPHTAGVAALYKAAGKTKQDFYDASTTGVLKGHRGGADRLVYAGPEESE